MIPLFYSPQSQADLTDLFRFIAADNPRRALSYIAEIQTACENLCTAPLIGTARPDLRPGLRILPLRRRVLIAYQVLPNRIEILRVFTGGRDYETIMGE